MLPVVLIPMVLVTGCGDKNNSTQGKTTNSQEKSLENINSLGVNFNERVGPQFVRFSELKNSHTTWVRGMLDFFQLYKEYQAGKEWTSNPRIITYQSIQEHGYKTVLGIRYMFKRENLTIPDKGTVRFDNYMKFMDMLLQEVMPATDVIVPGNEPILEALKVDKNSQRLADFYKALAKHTHAYIMKHDLDIPIFIGSFSNPYMPSRRNNKAYDNLLRFASNTDWVQGVDIHIHHSNNKQISEAMNYIINRIRSDQEIIISEFSLVFWWDKHTRDNLSAAFKAKYSLPEGINKVWEYLDYALKKPRPIEEWNDWNRLTPWLKDKRHYICKAWNIFKSYSNFWLAFYSFKIAHSSQFSSTSRTWILNSLLVNRTVKHKPNGDAYGRIWYMNDFKAIQDGRPTSCD